MKLTRYKLGELIEQSDEKNIELKYSSNDVKGMTITKEIINTKANVKNVDLKKFLIVYPFEFIYNPRTHGKKIGLGFNNTNKPFIISSNNISFRIKKEKLKIISPTYLFIYFNRSEWDREATINSWGSSTEVFSWSSLCDMSVNLPPLEIQEKYVVIYNAMIKNQQSYEKGLEDLKLVCDAYIEDLRRNITCEEIGNYIIKKDERNRLNNVKNVKGVSVFKEFREPTSKVNRNELKNYKIVSPKEISFVQTTHNEKVFAYALNNTFDDILVSSVNEVFKINKNVLIPEYLCLFFNRSEFDRYARFHSWGSARETFTFEDLKQVKIPIPDIKVQQSITDIYKVYKKRKDINEKLKTQIKDICKILIRGSIEEPKR